MKIIARIHSDFPEKFGIPRQSGLVEALEATIVFEPEYRNPAALMGITGYSHLWLLWQFSEAVRDTWSPTVHPPRLGGKKHYKPAYDFRKDRQGGKTDKNQIKRCNGYGSGKGNNSVFCEFL